MEKLVNMMFGILNWYENTAIRKDDPIEIAEMKTFQRRAAGAGCLTIVFAGLFMFVGSAIPENGKMSSAVAPLFSLIDNGVTYAFLAATIACLYYVGRSLYSYIQIGR